MQNTNASGTRTRAAAERARAWREAGLWDETTLFQHVRTHARSRPDSLAVVDAGGRRTTSRAELFETALRLAAHLHRRGVREGDVVSVQLPNQREAVAAAVAIQGLGAIVNPLLPGYRTRELAHVFEVARPKAILTPATHRDFDHRPLVDDVRTRTGVSPWHVVVGSPEGGEREEIGGDVGFHAACREGAAAARPDAPGGDARSVSEVIFTSGTESAPKAILHTEETVGFSLRVAWQDMGLCEDDVVWMPSPIGHSTGFNYGLRMALHFGLPLVLQDRWDARAAIGLVDTFGATYTLAATTFLKDLVDLARAEGRRLSSLRCFGCGGAPVPPALVRYARQVGIGVRRLYGSTEVLVATWNRADSPIACLDETDGRALSQVEVEVRDDAGRPCPAGEPGEIHVRGPNTCVGFLDDPERETRTISDEGWVRSGDLGVLDATGHLTIVGRSKDIVIRGGLNIAPREIEDLILAFPEVVSAAIVGVPDPRLGERCCACLVLRDGAELDLESLTRRLRDQGLATHKLPERLEILDSLPTTASGKIQKFRILERLGGHGKEEA
ncbi:MAG TPA: AMP-binding protein [Myxococcota bacterium]|nr:AMP-binding protein [Myxococcales bacterium]HPG26928.1 AMP-binding protein [Myxococcota bacterium]